MENDPLKLNQTWTLILAEDPNGRPQLALTASAARGEFTTKVTVDPLILWGMPLDRIAFFLNSEFALATQALLEIDNGK